MSWREASVTQWGNGCLTQRREGRKGEKVCKFAGGKWEVKNIAARKTRDLQTCTLATPLTALA